MSQYVLVTVRRGGEEHDVQISTDWTVEELCKTISQAYGWDQDTGGATHGYFILNQTIGRRLRAAETLAQARVWNGARLIFQPQSSPTPPASPPRRAETAAGQQPGSKDTITTQPQANSPVESPLVTWRRLINDPDEEEPPQEVPSEPDDRMTFTWKRLD